MGNVLIVVPMGPKGNRIKVATSWSVANLDWDGKLDILWLYNSDPSGHFEDLASKLNQASAVCLSGEYDGMLIVEYDMIVPVDALQSLAAVDADIAYGLYCGRTSSEHPWFIAKALDETTLTWHSKQERVSFWGNVVDSKGVGTGCTYVNRKTLARVSFRGGRFSPDWYLSMDAQLLGLTQKHHCGVICGHIIDDTSAVWPDASNDSLFRIDSYNKYRPLSPSGRYQILPKQTIAIDSKKELYREGDFVKLGPEQAAIMLRKGVVECA